MPPRGVKKGTKRARQYEHIKDSLKSRGKKRAEEIAARTVNKERARRGESHTSSRLSRKDISSGRRGGLRANRRSPARPNERAALRRGQAPRREGSLDDEQGSALASGVSEAQLRFQSPGRAGTTDPLWAETSGGTTQVGPDGHAFGVEVTSAVGGTAVVAVQGEADLHTAQELRRRSTTRSTVARPRSSWT